MPRYGLPKSFSGRRRASAWQRSLATSSLGSILCMSMTFVKLSCLILFLMCGASSPAPWRMNSMLWFWRSFAAWSTCSKSYATENAPLYRTVNFSFLFLGGHGLNFVVSTPPLTVFIFCGSAW